jgi:hypothetical protein
MQVENMIDAATNCGGRVLHVGGALADSAVTSIDWENRTAWANGAASVADVTRELLAQGWVPERLGGPSYLSIAGLVSLAVSGPYTQRTATHQTLPQRIHFIDGLGQQPICYLRDARLDWDRHSRANCDQARQLGLDVGGFDKMRNI